MAKIARESKITCPYFMLPDSQVWISNDVSRHIFPVGTRIILADSQTTFYQPHEAVPLNAPWSVRFVDDPTNPRAEMYYGDPDGFEKPCFSMGWGDYWFRNPLEIDQPVCCLTVIVQAGNLGFDYAMWDNEEFALGHAKVLASWVNGGKALVKYGMIEGVVDVTEPARESPPQNDVSKFLSGLVSEIEDNATTLRSLAGNLAQLANNIRQKIRK